MQKSSKCKYEMAGKEFQKKKYLRPEQAIESANSLNADQSKMHLFIAYKCTSCHFFHVGRSKKINPNYVQT